MDEDLLARFLASSPIPETYRVQATSVLQAPVCQRLSSLNVAPRSSSHCCYTLPHDSHGILTRDLLDKRDLAVSISVYLGEHGINERVLQILPERSKAFDQVWRAQEPVLVHVCQGSRDARGRDECQHAGVCDEGADRVSLSRGPRPSWEKTFLISCSSSLFGSSAIASFVCCSAMSPSAVSNSWGKAFARPSLFTRRLDGRVRRSSHRLTRVVCHWDMTRGRN